MTYKQQSRKAREIMLNMNKHVLEGKTEREELRRKKREQEASKRKEMAEKEEAEADICRLGGDSLKP